MGSWPPVREEESPFGLRVGDHMIWSELRVRRCEVLGPNWNYVVTDGEKSHVVNIFSPSRGSYRMLIHGEWRGIDLDTYIGEDVEADSVEHALVKALTRVLEIVRGVR